MTLNETPCVRRAEAGTGSERAPSTHEQQTILQPGRNRWRIRPALRASVLIDGADSFARLDTVLRQVR